MSDLDKALDLYDKSITLVGVEAIRPLAEAARAHQSCQQPDYGDMDDVPRERIREALDTYDLKLTKDWQIRVLAHAAEKFLIAGAALSGDSPT